MTLDSNEEERQGARASSPHSRSAWTPGIACACFFALSWWLMRAYSFLHWEILRDHSASLQAPVRVQLFRLLGYLAIYHLTALLCTGFGIWTFRGHPRWIRWACLPFSLLSLGIAIAVT